MSITKLKQWWKNNYRILKDSEKASISKPSVDSIFEHYKKDNAHSNISVEEFKLLSSRCGLGLTRTKKHRKNMMRCYNVEKLVITSCNTLSNNSLLPLKTSNLEKTDGLFKYLSKAVNDVAKGWPSFEDLHLRYPETFGHETHDHSKNSKNVISIIAHDVDDEGPSEIQDLKDTDVSNLKSFNQNQLSVSVCTNSIGDCTSSLRSLDLGETNGKTSRTSPPDLVYEPDYCRSPPEDTVFESTIAPVSKKSEENQGYIDSNANENINNCGLSSKGLNLVKVNSFGNEILAQSQSTLDFMPGTKTCSGENSSQKSCDMHLEDTDCCGKKVYHHSQSSWGFMSEVADDFERDSPNSPTSCCDNQEESSSEVDDFNSLDSEYKMPYSDSIHSDRSPLHVADNFKASNLDKHHHIDHENRDSRVSQCNSKSDSNVQYSVRKEQAKKLMNNDKGIDKFAKIADEIAVHVSEISNGDLKISIRYEKFPSLPRFTVTCLSCCKTFQLVMLVISTFTSKTFLMVPILILKLAARRLQMIKT